MTGIDIIGLIYDMGADGESPIPLPGFHVNITPPLLASRPELELLVVTPSALRRVWAGDDPANPTLTVALRFADEAEVLAFFPAV